MYRQHTYDFDYVYLRLRRFKNRHLPINRITNFLRKISTSRFAKLDKRFKHWLPGQTVDLLDV